MKSDPGKVERRQYDTRLREEQAAATRERVLSALSDMILNDHPASISIPAVAVRAGVSVSTVYRYFPTKEALFDGLYDWSALRLHSPRDATGAERPEDLARMVHIVFRNLDRDQAFYRVMQSTPIGRELRMRRAPERRAVVERALASVTESLDPEDARRLHAVAHLLSSSVALMHMEDFWGLSAEDAASTSAWALLALVKEARRTKEVRHVAE